MQKRKVTLKKNDPVKIIAGNDKGKEGKIIEICRSTYRAKVTNARLQTHYKKGNKQENKTGGIEKKEGWIDLSNLLFLEKGVPTRIGKKMDKENQLKRYSKKTGDFI